jgi:hypothetical protein
MKNLWIKVSRSRFKPSALRIKVRLVTGDITGHVSAYRNITTQLTLTFAIQEISASMNKAVPSIDNIKKFVSIMAMRPEILVEYITETSHTKYISENVGLFFNKLRCNEQPVMAFRKSSTAYLLPTI